MFAFDCDLTVFHAGAFDEAIAPGRPYRMVDKDRPGRCSTSENVAACSFNQAEKRWMDESLAL